MDDRLDGVTQGQRQRTDVDSAVADLGPIAVASGNLPGKVVPALDERKPADYRVVLRTRVFDGRDSANPAAIAKSGTIGLECALAGLPSLVAYRANVLTAALIRRMIRVKYVNLANILADRLIIPELLQEHCTAEEITRAILPLLTDTSARATQQAELTSIASMLGVNDTLSPSEKAAALVLGMV